MPSTDLGKIKGAAFREFVVWYGEKHDAQKLASAVQTLGRPDSFDSARPAYGILASEWYDARLVHGLIDRLTEDWPPDSIDQHAGDAADFIMGRTLKGIYKTMFSMLATPTRYARHVQKMWVQHYDSGEVIIEPTSSTHHDIRYRGWRSHHPFICRMNMASGEPIYAAMGCRGVSWECTSCVSKGDPDCRSVVRWQQDAG